MKPTLLILLLLLLWRDNSTAQIPRTISYQGDLRTSQGSPAPDGKHSFMLSFYNTFSGGTALYRETQFIDVTGGIFTFIIGTTAPIPDWLTFDSAYYLGISIDQGAELTPRTPFTSVPYALHAQVADGLSPNAYIPPGLIIGSTAPSGPALGDLWGTYPYPEVIGLQSRPISTLLPQRGDVFMWSGATWGPQPVPVPIAFHVGGDSFANSIIRFSIKSGNGFFDDGGFYDTVMNSFLVMKTGVYRFDLRVNGSVQQLYNQATNVHIAIALFIDKQGIGEQDYDVPIEYSELGVPDFYALPYASLLKLTQGQTVQVIVWSISDPALSTISADLSVFKLN